MHSKSAETFGSPPLPNTSTTTTAAATSATPFDPFEPSPRSKEFQIRMQQQQEDQEEFFFEAHATLAPMPDMPPPPPPAAMNSPLATTPSHVHVHARSRSCSPAPVLPVVQTPLTPTWIPSSPKPSAEGIPSSFEMPAGQVPSEIAPTIVSVPPSNNVKKKTKKSKKKKSKKKSKESTTSMKRHSKGDHDGDDGHSMGNPGTENENVTKKGKKGKGGGGKYYSQYSALSATHGMDPEDHGDVDSDHDNDGENSPSLFSFCRPQNKDSNYGGRNGHGNKNDEHLMPTPKIGKRMSQGVGVGARTNYGNGNNSVHGSGFRNSNRGMMGTGRRINTGELNSAAGEGTTLPQILFRIRFFTFLLSGLTIVFESYAIFFDALFLQAEKVILGVYLLFFIGLLLLFELVRGDPVPASSMTGVGMGMGVGVNGSTLLGGGLPFSNGMQAAHVAELAWTIVLEKKWARRTRYFLQNNFGILYSCVGRGIYLLFVGSIAVGQNFILIQVAGWGFMLMGLWNIALRCRFPSLEKTMIMNLDDEFGERGDDVSIGGGSSVVTWSSIPSSIRSDETRSLLNKSTGSGTRK